ncbi:MAG: Flp pilus assembly complex ATPase component TadA [Phycisphaerales bacterium]|nr:Flp pilus assembly complex ATPase component TadA [Phycisphaerales bacterium]
MIVSLDLLAQVPQGAILIQPFKLLALVLVFTAWAAIAQWVDKDAVAVNTYRILWNLITLSAGVVGLLVGLFIPIFWVGFPSMFVVVMGAGLAYVLHRNALVPEVDKVLTAAHFRRLREEGLSRRKKVIEVKERVRLAGADRKPVPIPTDEVPREQFRLTQDLLFNAFWRRATVVEVAPAGPQAAKITYFVDGMPIEGDPIARADGDAMIQFLKQIAGLDLEERRKPQKGQITAAIGDNKHRIFVRSDGSTAGERLSFQILRREGEFKVPDLGFTPRQLEIVQATKEDSKGLIVLTAPPKEGLTTTIYSFVRNHDRFLQNVQMLETEIELEIDNVTQQVVTPTETTTFGERLMKVVRSDPDIIVLPDLRDREAAAIAAKSASEKQKVYVSLPALDVFDGLARWLKLVGDKNLATKALLGVGNQRLIRLLCPECKQAYKPDSNMMRRLNLPEDKVLFRTPEPQYDKHGNPILCQACQGTGYTGRTAVFDWLVIDEGLRQLIRSADSLAEVKKYAIKRGGIGLQAQALEKVLAGQTSIQEVARVVKANSAPAAAPQPKPQSRPPASAK